MMELVDDNREVFCIAEDNDVTFPKFRLLPYWVLIDVGSVWSAILVESVFDEELVRISAVVDFGMVRRERDRGLDIAVFRIRNPVRFSGSGSSDDEPVNSFSENQSPTRKGIFVLRIHLEPHARSRIFESLQLKEREPLLILEHSAIHFLESASSRFGIGYPIPTFKPNHWRIGFGRSTNVLPRPNLCECVQCNRMCTRLKIRQGG
jgi:hypothetical protein